eukprot:1143442-Pelagomonas_calceolata.AAC.3
MSDSRKYTSVFPHDVQRSREQHYSENCHPEPFPCACMCAFRRSCHDGLGGTWRSAKKTEEQGQVSLASFTSTLVPARFDFAYHFLRAIEGSVDRMACWGHLSSSAYYFNVYD